MHPTTTLRGHLDQGLGVLAVPHRGVLRTTQRTTVIKDRRVVAHGRAARRLRQALRELIEERAMVTVVERDAAGAARRQITQEPWAGRPERSCWVVDANGASRWSKSGQRWGRIGRSDPLSELEAGLGRLWEAPVRLVSSAGVVDFLLDGRTTLDLLAVTGAPDPSLPETGLTATGQVRPGPRSLGLSLRVAIAQQGDGDGPGGRIDLALEAAWEVAEVDPIDLPVVSPGYPDAADLAAIFAEPRPRS